MHLRSLFLLLLGLCRSLATEGPFSLCLNRRAAVARLKLTAPRAIDLLRSHKSLYLKLFSSNFIPARRMPVSRVDGGT
jgi:hypothetical protein